MRRHVVIRAERLAHPADHHGLEPGRAFAGQVEEEHRHQHVAPARDAVSQLGRQLAAEPVGEGVLGGAGDDVGGRALQHRHMGGGFGHRRHQGNGGGAAADHDNPLAGVVERFRPFLRVHQLAAVLLDAGEVRQVAAGVVVVAAAAIDEAAGEADGLRAVLGLDCPGGVRRRPGDAYDPVIEADLLVHPVRDGRLADVFQDGGAVGDRLGLGPGAERVAEGIHVGVGAHAGVAEQIPGAAAAVARFEDEEGFARVAHGQMAPGADAGQASADDQDVEMLHEGSPSSLWACAISVGGD